MKSVKYYSMICIVLFFTASFTSCSSKQETLLNKSSSSVQLNQEIQEPISKEIFYKTIEKYDSDLYNDPRVSETCSEKMLLLKQQYIDPHNNFIIVWSNDLGFTSILEIFQIKDSNWIPIYYSKYGLRIEALRIFDNIIEGKQLIDIIHYNNGIQFVSLLCLDFNSIKTVWENILLQEDNNQTSFFYKSNSYTIVPGYLKSSLANNRIPSIIFHQREEISTVKDSVIDKEIITTDIYYIWDEKEYKFVKTSKL